MIAQILATFARALLADGCGKALRLVLAAAVPELSPLACDVIGLCLGVILVEAVCHWHGRTH